MNQRVTSIEAIRKIDGVLLSTKNTLSFSGKHYVEPVKAVELIDSSFDNFQRELKKEQLEERAKEANDAIRRVNAQLTFRIHEGTGRTLVQLVEKETNTVIREIPPEKMLDVIAGIWQWSGITIDRME